VFARQQPLRFGEAAASRVLERAQGLGALPRRYALAAQHQLCIDEAGPRHPAVVGALVPATDGLGTLAGQVEGNMVADQLPCLGAALSRGTVQPVQGRGQALRQACAAEQVEAAQLQLGLGPAGARATDDC
jgi:hypothetical protein